MTIRGQITERDFVRAAFLHIRPRRTFAVLGAAVVLLGAFASFWAIAGALPGERRPILGFAVLLSFGYLALYFAAWYPYTARRTYRQYKAVAVPFIAEIESEGIRIESELGGGILPWSHIHKWREGASLFLLYPTDALYHIFPKSLFSNALLEEFRALLKRQLGPEA